MAEYPHRQVSVTVDSIDPRVSQKEIEDALENAKRALRPLGEVGVYETPEPYRRSL